jgi:hypothetical protein
MKYFGPFSSLGFSSFAFDDSDLGRPSLVVSACVRALACFERAAAFDALLDDGFVVVSLASDFDDPSSALPVSDAPVPLGLVPSELG